MGISRNAKKYENIYLWLKELLDYQEVIKAHLEMNFHPVAIKANLKFIFTSVLICRNFITFLVNFYYEPLSQFIICIYIQFAFTLVTMYEPVFFTMLII